ncbi:MAG: 5'-methylthioadenosine/adenosylhomocysteine nucleosidase [Alphaproteobacteria bacterium]|nr:5'-methylthioadenosine/adenosylhomocysteine nucleosidase [Alphaproteobacteria bacterium]
MKHIGLMFAMDAEMKFFASILENLQQQTLHQRTFYTGVVGNKIITAVISGMGKVNAALCTADLIAVFKADIILNIGISGGLDTSLEIGDFVVGKDIVYHDVWCGNPNQYGQIQNMPAIYHSASELVDKVTQYRQGLLCCGDYFVEKAEMLQDIKAHFPAALAVDMESGAIAQTCYLYDVPLLTVRQISDVPGSENHAEQYASFWQNAPKHSMQVLREILEKL